LIQIQIGQGLELMAVVTALSQGNESSYSRVRSRSWMPGIHDEILAKGEPASQY
jgi:hypothetical protein